MGRYVGLCKRALAGRSLSFASLGGRSADGAHPSIGDMFHEARSATTAFVAVFKVADIYSHAAYVPMDNPFSTCLPRGD